MRQRARWWWCAAIALLVGMFATSASASPDGTTDVRDVPEPMRFDLVRGLRAEAGELEANVVTIAPLTGPMRFEWAPEIEWAPLPNFAIELEVPMSDRHVEAAKLSAQLTFRRPHTRRFAHGLQLSASVPLEGRASGHLVHVVAARLGERVGIVAMLGPRLELVRRVEPAILLNGAAFVSLPGEHALGLETNWSRSRERGELTLLPQVHLRIGPHVRVQLGIGAHHASAPGRWGAVAGVRLIVER